MLMKYGVYPFPVNGVAFAERATIHRNDAGMPETVTLRITTTGYLLADNGQTTAQAQDDLSRKEVLLKAALGVPFQNLIVYGDDDSVMATSMTNAGTLTGVRLVDGPNFPGRPATGEYCVQRAFEFAMEADYLYPKRLTALHSFSESIAFSGGLPEKKMVRSLNIAPQDQVLWPFTEFEATQTGTAVGLLDWPFGGPKSMPPYRFPASTLRGAPKIDASGPKRVGPTGQLYYSVHWSATFASALPLIATPTIWNF